jgi:hypothetical protein
MLGISRNEEKEKQIKKFKGPREAAGDLDRHVL